MITVHLAATACTLCQTELVSTQCNFIYHHLTDSQTTLCFTSGPLFKGKSCIIYSHSFYEGHSGAHAVLNG